MGNLTIKTILWWRWIRAGLSLKHGFSTSSETNLHWLCQSEPTIKKLFLVLLCFVRPLLSRLFWSYIGLFNPGKTMNERKAEKPKHFSGTQEANKDDDNTG